MTTLYLTHPDCAAHLMPEGHPEQVARWHAVQEALAAPAFEALLREEAPLCAETEPLRCHPQRYLDRLSAAAPAEGTAPLDPDTHISAGTLTAARRAIGGVERAIDAVLAGEARNAFVGCRPPGHHAETEKPMGFCLFGTAAIGAKYALDHHGLARVAVLDFDVHHGNGTQALLWDEPRAMFADSHQSPLWPGSGNADERGAHGQMLNHPLAPGSSGALALEAWRGEILPAVEAFAPELLIICAGFDAHTDDPLAQLAWETEDFAALTAEICALAEQVCAGRVVSTLEGGYDLTALAGSVAAHLGALMEAGR